MGNKVSSAEDIRGRVDAAKEGGDSLMALAAQLWHERNTLRAYVASRDCLLIERACRGLGTDDEALIDVVCGRTKDQIAATAAEYHRAWGKTLDDEIKDECGGDYGRFLRLVALQPPQADALLLDKAMDGVGCDKAAVTMIFATRTNDELRAMREAWEAKHDGASLLDRLHEELGGAHRTLVLKLLTEGRKEEEDDVDEDAAKETAKELYKAGVGKLMGTDEEVFFNAFTGLSRAQLNQVAEIYERKRGMSLQKAIKKEFPSASTDLLQSMLETPIQILSRKLSEAFKGIGTDEALLTAVLAARGRAQAREVMTAFNERYGKELVDEVKREVGGNFRRAVTRWLEGEDYTRGAWTATGTPPEELEGDEGALEALVEALQTELANTREYILATDVKTLHKALHGVGTDEEAVVTVLGARNKTQLQDVCKMYHDEHDESLPERLASRLGGDFGRFCRMLVLDEPNAAAVSLHKALEGIGADCSVVMEILAARERESLLAAREAYEGRFEENLLDRLVSELSGTNEMVARALLTEGRGYADGELEDVDAVVEELHAAGQAQIGTDEAVFARIFTMYSVDSLRRINEAYEGAHGRSLQRVVSSEFGGNAKRTLLALLSSSEDLLTAQLSKAMKGSFTNERALTRILAGRDKAKAMQLAARYEEKYGSPLVDRVRRKLGGDLRRIVVGWITTLDPTLGAEELKRAASEGQGEDEEGVDLEDAAAEEEVEVEVAEEEEEAQDQVDEEEQERLRLIAEAEEAERQRKEEEKRLRRAIRAANNAANRQQRRGRGRMDKVKGGKLPLGTVVVGDFDDDAYAAVNRTDGGAEAFANEGAADGMLAVVRREGAGVFAGLVDTTRLLELLGAEPTPQEEPPHNVQLQANAALAAAAAEGGLPALPLQPAAILWAEGRFQAGAYWTVNPDARVYAHRPRPGRFQPEGYLRLHPEAEGEDPVVHFSENFQEEGHLIMINNRVGTLDRRFYRRRHNDRRARRRPGRHFRRREGRPLMRLEGGALTPWQHFVQRGREEGRRVRVVSPRLGVVEGVFDDEHTAVMHGLAGPEEAWGFVVDNGPGTPFAVTDAEPIWVWGADGDGDEDAAESQLVEPEPEPEDEDYDDDEGDDDDDEDDDGGDDDDDDDDED